MEAECGYLAGEVQPGEQEAGPGASRPVVMDRVVGRWEAEAG